MARQFANVASRYGARMGRHDVPDLDTSPGSVRLFAVRLDAGGYDDGGAYWGHGDRLWCARDKDGDERFMRASSRERAAMLLNIPAPALVCGFAWASYVTDIIDGRAPKPPGMDISDVMAWAELCRIVSLETRA